MINNDGACEVGRRNWQRFAAAACLALVTGLVFSPGKADAQDTSGDPSDLAAQLANPIAALISVPIQANYDHGLGSKDGDRLLTNFQPVVPFDLPNGWGLVTRTIVPVAWQNDISGSSKAQFGLGDTLQSYFLVPPSTPTGLGNLTWGLGPAVTWPTSTDPLLGLGTWGAGPTGIALFQK